MTAPVTVVAASSTHVGMRRSLNEDSCLAAPPLFLVADGMGGHNAGERASAVVIEQFAGLIGQDAVSLEDVQQALVRARAAVDALSGDDAVQSRAGTTLSGVVVASVDGLGYWLAFNIGDSRTYRFSDDELEQITVDHSVVQELIDSGELTPEQAGVDPRRNIITRAIGAGSAGEADYWLFPAEAGDRMLVCSDGLTAEVPERVICEILRSESDPQRAADLLAHEAVEAGGRDNVTVVVADATTVASSAGALLHTESADEDTRPRHALLGGG